MKTCENCGFEHDGSYGSGRFCSVKCAKDLILKKNEKRSMKKLVKNNITG